MQDVQGTVSRTVSDGVVTSFAYNWRIFSDEHLTVIHEPDGFDPVVVPPADYAVTGVNLPDGGLVVFTAAPAAGEITIFLNMPYEQTTSFPSDSAPIETALDRQVKMLQQMQRDVGGSLRLPLGLPPGWDLVLPAVDDLAEDVLMMLDVSEMGIVYVPSTGIQGPQGIPGPGGDMSGANNLQEVVDLGDIAAARGNLGLGAAAVEGVQDGGVGDLLRGDGVGGALTGVAHTKNGSAHNVFEGQIHTRQNWFDMGTVGGDWTPSQTVSPKQKLIVTAAMAVQSMPAEGSVMVRVTQDATGGHPITFNGYTQAWVDKVEVNTGPNEDTWLWLENDGAGNFVWSIQPAGLYA